MDTLIFIIHGKWQDFDIVGDHCEVMTDYCESAPCMNDGNCTAIPAKYECQCDDTEFTGKI